MHDVIMRLVAGDRSVSDTTRAEAKSAVGMRLRRWFAIAVLVLLPPCLAFSEGTPATGPNADVPWTVSAPYRLMLHIDPRRGGRSNSPVSVELDLDRGLTEPGAVADANSVSVVTYTADGAANSSQSGVDRYVVPHRVDRYFGSTRITLSFVLPDERCTRAAVYFDEVGGRKTRPRPPGIVGDGDRFREEWATREINASHFDRFCDFDGDGDLDLFKGGVEPYVYCYENTGKGRMVDRGRLTSGGKLFVLPHSEGAGRSWVTVAFHDWDGDGDPDFLPSFGDGPDRGRFVFYRNTTREHNGQLTFERVGPLLTAAGNPVAGGEQAGGWFPSVAFARDWDGDGDGRTDLIVGSNHHGYVYRNLGTGSDGLPRLSEAATLKNGEKEIVLTNPRFDCADLDGDGDLDLLAGTQPGAVLWFRNVGQPERPYLAVGNVVAYPGRYLIGDAHSGVKAADFDGDGRMDLVTGRFWERADLDRLDTPREFGGLHRAVGPRTQPRFERRSAQQGSPFIEGYPLCDAIRQNGVRSADWDRDGKTDLLAGDTDGFVWLFRNRGTAGWPLFAAGKKLQAGRGLLSVAGSGGHARFDLSDWNGDGRLDLLTADGDGNVTLFAGDGRSARLGAPEPIRVNGQPIKVGNRASSLVCDWDGDGKQDLVLADDKGYHLFRNTGTNAQPQLAPGTPIRFAGALPGYVRPNLGDFVDWDGDGARDLIGCHFENRILLYRNVAGGPGAPRFDAAEGVTLVEPATVQMISGAEAVDWNKDGDLDLLTGQGHGGSALRFFERDYIEDTQRRTHPVATVLTLESRASRRTVR